MLAKQMLIVCLVGMIFAASGCAPKLVGSDAAVYQNSKLYANSSKDIEAVYQAALQAMDKLQLKVTDKVKDAFGARVVAKSSDDKIITVSMKPSEDKKTTYTIQVGTLGSEDRSQKIYAEMENALGKSK
jgi:hypothetical protein